MVHAIFQVFFERKKTVLNKAKRINTFASAAAFSVAAFSAKGLFSFSLEC
jgi:hypothetical protein